MDRRVNCGAVEDCPYVWTERKITSDAAHRRAACVDGTPTLASEALSAWLTGLGIDPNSVWSVEYDLVDAPLLRLERYLRNEVRQPYLAHLDGDCPDPSTRFGARRSCSHIAMETVEVPLRAELPEWWRPA